MPKQPPAFRLLTKNEGDEKLHEIGQVWKTARDDVFSVSLDLEDTGERINFIMMPNTPKPQPATRPQGTQQRPVPRPAPRPAG